MIYHIAVLCLLLFFLAFVLRNLRDYAVIDPRSRPAEARLFVLIPARNEAENIADCLNALLTQAGTFDILVLDDGSEDDTAAIVQQIAASHSNVGLLCGKPIPAEWAGKVWACSQLAEEAQKQGAEWLLFLDADTRACPGFVPALLHYAQATRAAMVSTFPYQVTGSFWERVVLPMLHFLITTFLPIRMVWETDFPGLVAACGQVELFSADAYRAVGGHASIQASFHDGLQLARRIKAAGLPVRLCDASALISCRMYAGGKAVWSGFTRNAYEGLGSPAALIVMTLLQVWLFLTPYVFLGAWLVLRLLHGRWEIWGWICAAQVMMILLIRGAQARRFGHPEAVLLHPISIAALVVIQWASYWKALRGAPISWKGRAYNNDG